MPIIASMKDSKHIHYQTWCEECPVALRFRYTEIAFTLDGLKELRDELDEAIKNLENGESR